MQFLKDYFKQYGPLGVLLITTISIPLYSGIQAYEPAQVTLQTADPAPQKVSVSDLLPVLQKIAQRPTETHTVHQPAIQPIPDPFINAITKMSEDINHLAELTEQNREIISMLKRTEAKVDRNGNTKEALNDIYSDVEVPDLPDPLAKGLAKHPGARIVVHPEVGVPVLAKTEWIRTHGGRVLQLKRHNGRERPVTIEYSASAPAPAPKPEPFRLSLGNN